MTTDRNTDEHALTRSQSSTPRSIANRLPVAVQRALPAVARSAAGLAVGIVADYAVRSLTRRAATALSAPLRRAVKSAAPAARGMERHIVTEMVVIERTSRR